MKSLRTYRLLGLAMITALLSGACSSDLIEQPEEQPKEGTGEIRTLVFGLPRTQETRSLLGPESLVDTRTDVTLNDDGTAKIQWTAGDQIVALKGNTQYIYKLKSTGADGKGVFEAVGAGLPELTGNTTDNVYIYHLGSNSYNYISGECVTNNQSSAGYHLLTQVGNDNAGHLKENVVLKLEAVTPTSAEALSGTLSPLSTVMSFEIAAPDGLEAGELPIDVILTNLSNGGSSYFMEQAALMVGGELQILDDVDSRKLRKNGVHLSGITEWNASNPLKAHFNVMLGGEQNPADTWYLEVQTNKGNLYVSSFTTSVTIEGGKRYVTPISGLTLSALAPAVTIECTQYNSIAAEFSGLINETVTCCYGTTYSQLYYAGIQWSTDPSFESPQMYYFEGGKGDYFVGLGSLITYVDGGGILQPSTTYYYRTFLEIDGNVTYYGKTLSITTPAVSLPTDNAAGVDLGGSVIWDVMNLGAAKVEDYGNYYAWGAKSAGNVFSQAGYDVVTFEDAATAADASKRVPTYSEIEELQSLPQDAAFTYNGVKGVLFVAWSNTAIFFPYAGYKHEGTYANMQGKEAYYWSSTKNSSDDTKAYILRTQYGYDFWMNPQNSQLVYDGCPIRPVRDKSSD